MKVSVTLFILVLSFGSFSQNTDLGNWIVYFGNARIKSKLNWHHEVQYRNYNAVGDLEQLLLRTGLGYNLTENNNNLHLGYAFIYSQNYLENFETKTALNEHRIYQKFITRRSISRVHVQHRYRFEQRWIDDQDLQLRFRYFLSLNIPLNNKAMQDNTWYCSIYNEIFINHRDVIFDRNRLYVGAGYQLNKTAKFEIGYMNQFLTSSNRDQLNIITFINF